MERGRAMRSGGGRGTIWRWLLVLVLLVGLGGGVLSPARVALAAGFTLTAFDDATNGDYDDDSPGDSVCADINGRCTLRAAIQEANALAGADTITLPAGTYTLAGALPTVTGPLTMQGQGGSATIAAGGPGYSILTINDGTASAIPVTISDLIISGGRANNGGGINSAENLTLSNVAIRDNRATSLGGGVRNDNGSLTIIGGEFRDNQAGDNGGAVSSFNFVISPGTLALAGVTITNNRADKFGGGIYIVNTTTTVSGGTIQGNAAGNPGNGWGGGIYGAAPLALSGVTISGNTATCRGAGLYLASDATITGGAISANSATGACSGVTPNEGGGIFKNGGSLALVNATVSGNTAANGAGIYNINQLYVRGSTISGNTANGYGGGLVVRAPAGDVEGRYYATVSNSTLSGNTANGFGFAGGLAAAGGGLYNSGLVFLLDATVANNSTGISSQASVAVLQGTLLANTSANCAAAAPAMFVSAGHNLSADASCNTLLTATGDLRNIAPQLAALASNAPGTTQTHALGLTSPARDAGSCTLDFDPATYKDPSTTGPVLDPGLNLAIDQRGVARPQRLGCDIGAFEPVNTAPVAVNDSHTTPRDTLLNVAAPGVLGNDSDADGNPLTATIVSAPAHGGFTYTPAAGYGGPDSFTYRASDGALTSNIATVSITIPAPPVTGADTYSTQANTPLTIAAPGVLANDSDPNGDALTAQLVSGPAHGTLALGASGGFTYTPAAGYSGPDSFTYAASDGTFTTPVTVGLTVVAPPTIALTLTTAGSGSGTASPAGTTPHAPGAAVTLTATAAQGNVFTGWSLDGVLVSWQPSVTLTMNAAHVVVATFQPLPAFGDVPAGQPFTDPVQQLAARGIINGCDKDAKPLPLFCPDAPTLRHQMAALIVRAIPGWQDETGLPSFTDNTDDTELMTRVATLQRHNVVRGYQDEVCAAQGKTPPCYGPLDTVKYGQVLLFIARAMVAKGYWALQPDDRGIFPDQNGPAGADPSTDQQTLDHRHVVTYVHYVGSVPDVADVRAPFAVATAQGVKGWGDDSSRGWFTRAFWPALQSYFGTDTLP